METPLPLSEALELDIPRLMVPVLADLQAMVLAHQEEVMGAECESCVSQLHLILGWAESQLSEITRLHEVAALFSNRFANAPEEKEQEAAILDFAAELGASPQQLERDRKALRVYFDQDAVMERYRRRVAECERAASYGLERAGTLLAYALRSGEIAPQDAFFGERLGPSLQGFWHYRGDMRVRLAAHRCLKQAAEATPRRFEGVWLDTPLSAIRRVALDEEDDAWLQCEALSSLFLISPESLVAILKRRFSDGLGSASPQALDNRIFVRRHLARLLIRFVGERPELDPFLRRLANDRDGAVRQAVAASIPDLPGDLFPGYFAKMRVDRDPQVRAILFDDPSAMADAAGGEPYLTLILRIFRREKDEFVLRIALSAAETFAQWQFQRDESSLASVVERLQDAVGDLRKRSESLKVRRWAGETRERLWLIGNAEARAIAAAIQAWAAQLKEGQKCAIPYTEGAALDDTELVGRVLSILGGPDFGFQYRAGRRKAVLWRGDRFRDRLWRILHEVRISATDKRQAWRHTIGRRFEAPVIAPPAHMAELAPTKVPGEPLHQSSEAGWRNYIPLLDHALSVIDCGGEMKLYTSEGVTTLRSPRGLFRRLSAYWRISWKFGMIAPLRNSHNNDFVQTLRRYGLEVDYAPHLDSAGEPLDADPEVVRFFSFGGVLIAAPLLFDRALDYFGTVLQNSLLDLTIFLVLAGGFFFGKHVVAGQRMRRMRDNIALSLGGWGTRGKSGTERLKAGLINALGHPLVSKTTGCEAMFLHGPAFGELQELFLFRPYDKATIWEQFNLVRMTNGLKGRVYLWECMGLAPQFVRVLQKDWMRDTIGTITNTYPDHEDVQGPAGRNIPEVMTQFIPENSILLTTEEEMLPILQEGADRYGTRLRAVGWKQAGLIHQSLLARFPYAEHPYNIALVTAMADELGMEPDFAVREMSDRVVADLGVLKIYPRSNVYDRTLEFVMGMSANERFGAMGNWDRMGFAEHDLAKDPEIYVTTVVNNRADRVPRSRVFARMLVRDVAADRHFLIGSNIEGLCGFIDEEWDAYAATLTLFEGEKPPAQVLRSLALQQRVPLNTEQIASRLCAMLKGLDRPIDPDAAHKAVVDGKLSALLAEAGTPYAEEIGQHIEEQMVLYQGYEALAQRLEKGETGAGLDQEARAFLGKAFAQKIVPVRDYYMPGEDIVRLVARNTPPGLINRIMGMQNIKGTGLDWVYRWQAWETVHKACGQMQDRDPSTARKGADLLASFQEFGILSAGHVNQVIDELQDESSQVDAMVAAQLEPIRARVAGQMAALDAAAGGGDDGGDTGKGWIGKLIDLLEAWLDSHDALRRRGKAELIYQALINEQISSPRAALELKKLVSRQKGGWFPVAIANWRARWSQRLRISRTRPDASEPVA